MKKLPYILLVISIILIISPIIIKNYKTKNIKNKMHEYCNQIFSGIEEDFDETKITIKNMKEYYELDISIFKNIDQESYIIASSKNNKLKCSVKLLK